MLTSGDLGRSLSPAPSVSSAIGARALLLPGRWRKSGIGCSAAATLCRWTRYWRWRRTVFCAGDVSAARGGVSAGGRAGAAHLALRRCQWRWAFLPGGRRGVSTSGGVRRRGRRGLSQPEFAALGNVSMRAGCGGGDAGADRGGCLAAGILQGGAAAEGIP
jgi:hypothetical protein